MYIKVESEDGNEIMPIITRADLKQHWIEVRQRDIKQAMECTRLLKLFERREAARRNKSK